MRDVLGHGLLRLRIELIMHLPDHGAGDCQKLIVFVIREVDVMGNPRAHTRIGLEECVHAVFVASKNHHQVISAVLHYLQHDLNGLLAIVPLVLGSVEVIGLVDKENPAHCLFEHLLGFGCRVTNVLAHQVIAGHAHHMALANVAKPVKDRSHLHGHGGLARARIAGKTHVQGRSARLKAHLLPGL